MPLEAVIFDLDLTLIASSEAEALRKSRAWSEVYKLIPRLEPYEGVTALIAALNQRGVKVAVVTSSPGPYCSRVIKHWNWAITTTVCYHDTPQKKPHPAPILKALELLGVNAANAVAIGDNPDDIASAKAAGITAIAATWGAEDPDALLLGNPDVVCTSVAELAAHLGL